MRIGIEKVYVFLLCSVCVELTRTFAIEHSTRSRGEIIVSDIGKRVNNVPDQIGDQSSVTIGNAERERKACRPLVDSITGGIDNAAQQCRKLSDLREVVSDLDSQLDRRDLMIKINDRQSCFFIDKDDELMVCNDNSLLRIPTDQIPQTLTYLKVVHLSITTIEHEDFAGKMIDILSITKTTLTTITRSSFSGLGSVKILILANNQLQINNSEEYNFFFIFQELTELVFLDLSGNNISLLGVDQHVKTDGPVLPSLEGISFSNNPIRRLERNLLYPLRLTSLREITCQNCSLDSIDPYVFQNLNWLETLNLRSNPSLLRLADNHPPLSAALYFLPKYSFSELDLSYNELTLLPYLSLYVTGVSLRKLDLSGNRLNRLFTLTKFPAMSNLEDLNLSNNNILTLHDLALTQMPKLEAIDLTNNQLCDVPLAVKLPTVKVLNLSKQCCPGYICSSLSISKFSLDEGSFTGMISLRTLILTETLTSLGENDLASAPFLETLNISSFFLQTISQGAFKKLTQLKSLTCTQCWLLESVSLETWKDLKYLEYLDLSYSPLSLKSKNNIGNFNGILEYIKVLNLTCALVGNINICNTENYTYESPLDPNLLIAMKDLEVLNLNKNGLTTWQERRFSANTKLTHLSLAFNKFRTISTAMLEDFKNLNYLDLRSGRDQYLLCNVQIVLFYKWTLQKNSSLKIEGWNEGEGYLCDDLTRIRTFRNFSLEYEITAAQNTTSSGSRLEGYIVGGVLSLVTLLLCIFFSYRQRLYILFWILRTKRRSKEDHEEKTPPYYDVFISYSQGDDDWVSHQLLPQLEQTQPQLRACLHHRDFKVGKPVVENIVESIENSSVFLMVLSDSFLASRWCVFETYVAQQINPKLNMNNIVIILKEELDRKPSKNIAFLLKTQTYIQWKEDDQKKEDFWSRVKQALLQRSYSAKYLNSVT